MQANDGQPFSLVRPGLATEPSHGTSAQEVIELRANAIAWRPLYQAGAMSAMLMLAMVPLAVLVYVVWPPPFDEGARAWLTLFQDNWLRGLLGLDLLFLLSNVLMIPIYLALYVALRRANPSLMALALGFGAIGLAAYFSSNTAFQMLLLSNRYAEATSETDRVAILAAAEAMMATFEGTAFNVYYVLSAIALLIISFVMLRSDVFSRNTAYVGLVAGAFMIIPASAGTLGAIFSFLSLIPWMVFLVLIARRLIQPGYAVNPLTEMEGS